MAAATWKVFSDGTHLVGEDDKALCGVKVDASKSVEFGPVRSTFLKNCVGCMGEYERVRALQLAIASRMSSRGVPRAARSRTTT